MLLCLDLFLENSLFYLNNQILFLCHLNFQSKNDSKELYKLWVQKVTQAKLKTIIRGKKAKGGLMEATTRLKRQGLKKGGIARGCGKVMRRKKTQMIAMV